MERSSNPQSGFTLLEVLTITLIIGILMGLAIPFWNKAREGAEVTRFTSDMRTFRQTLEMYIMEQGPQISESPSGVLPDELDGWVSRDSFEGPSPVGGRWSIFTYDDGDGPRLAIGVDWSGGGYMPRDEVLLRVDEAMDDGHLASGNLRMASASVFAYHLY